MSLSPQHHRVKAWARSLGARCDLCPNAKDPAVGADANPSPEFVVVGEAPGRAEEKLGRPFVGASGKMVDALLSANRLKRANGHLTNAALCRSEHDLQNETAAVCCAPRLLTEIGRLPQVPILAFGKTAVVSLLGLKNILLTRGFVWEMPSLVEEVAKARKATLRQAPFSAGRSRAELKLDTLVGRDELVGRVLVPSVHPAFVLRSEPWTPIIRVDVARFSRVVRGEVTLENLADMGTHLATQNMSRLYSLGSAVSLDVETTHTGSALTAKLLCVGLSDVKRTVVLWPWKKKMAKPLSRFLHSREIVVGHNLMQFDKVVLERHGVR